MLPQADKARRLLSPTVQADTMDPKLGKVTWGAENTTPPPSPPPEMKGET